MVSPRPQEKCLHCGDSLCPANTRHRDNVVSVLVAGPTLKLHSVNVSCLLVGGKLLTEEIATNIDSLLDQRETRQPNTDPVFVQCILLDWWWYNLQRNCRTICKQRNSMRQGVNRDSESTSQSDGIRQGGTSRSPRGIPSPTPDCCEAHTPAAKHFSICNSRRSLPWTVKDTGRRLSERTQNICMTFVQCWTNVEDVGLTLCKSYTTVLCSLGSRKLHIFKTIFLIT